VDVAHAGIVALGPAAVKRRGSPAGSRSVTCPAVLGAIYDGWFDGVIYFAAVIGMWWAFFRFLRDEEGYWTLIPILVFTFGLLAASAHAWGLG
jgi:hypothetical protein